MSQAELKKHSELPNGFSCINEENGVICLIYKDKTQLLGAKFIQKSRESLLSGYEKRRIASLCNELKSFTRVYFFDDKSYHLDASVNMSDHEYNLAIQHMIYEKSIISSLDPSLEIQNTILRLMEKLKEWSLKTYEGKKMPFGVIVRPYHLDTSTIDYFTVLDDRYCSVFADGMNTVVEIASDGKLINYSAVNQIKKEKENTNANDNKKITNVLIAYERLTKWCSEKTYGIVLTLNGHILLIANQQVVYAYKNGNWVHYCNSELYSLMFNRIHIDKDLFYSIYSDLIELSLTKTGGLIAIIDECNTHIMQAISSQDSAKATPSIKKTFVGNVTNTNYCVLERSIRRELLSQDGATVVDNKGRILLCGEIVGVDGKGSPEGGRTKAAMSLSKLGVAIKISEDGNVSCYFQGKEFYSIN